MVFTDPLIGRQLGSFRIERLLGRGGMASVYYGVDVLLQRPAAIKVVDERYQGSSTYAARFEREARAMARWRHPNIPQVYQAGQEAGISYYAMEFVQGADLKELMRRHRQKGELLPYTEIVRIGWAVAEALDYAHLQGAVHRDVKPANVLVADDGRVLLTDFGLVMVQAEATQGEVFGSPHYIAPEQARNSAQAVPQSDLYSLGVMMYELLTGEVPFDDPSAASLALKHLTQPPSPPRQINPDLPPAVEPILLKALQKSPQERYQTGRSFITELESALAPTVPVTVQWPAEILPPPVPPAVGETQPMAAATLPSGGAAYSPPPAYPAEPDATAPAKAPTSRRAAIGAGCVALFGLVGLALVLGVALLLALPDRQSATPIGGGASTRTVELAASTAWPSTTEAPATLPATDTPLPAPTDTPVPPSPTPVPPTPTAPPPPTAEPPVVIPEGRTVVNLLLEMNKDDSLFVVNSGRSDFPLKPLLLTNGKGEVKGEEWEVNRLEPGECVSVWKKEGRAQPPKGLKCSQVGERLVRSGGEKYWTGSFDVYYLGHKVGTCQGGKKSNSCEIRFTILAGDVSPNVENDDD